MKTNNKQITHKELKESTLRKNFFITLTNVSVNIPHLKIGEIHDTLIKLSPGKTFICKEAHFNKEDFHYHIIYLTKRGLSKNTARERIEELFPTFASSFTIKVEGIKSTLATFEYIVKETHPRRIIKFLERAEFREDLFTRITPNELKKVTKKSKRINSLILIHQIRKFKTQEE